MDAGIATADTKATELESDFRSLKTELGLLAVYHASQNRVAGYLFIAVLAWHCVQVLRRPLKPTNINDRWGTPRENSYMPYNL